MDSYAIVKSGFIKFRYYNSMQAQPPDIKIKIPKEKKIRGEPMAPKPRVKKPRKNKSGNVFSVKQGSFVVTFD